MKELIVIMGTIMLGCFIFQLMVGDTNSIKSSVESYFADLVRQVSR